MKRKLIAMSIATIMVFGVLTGCGDSKSKTADSAAPAKTTETAKENTDKPKENTEEAKKDTSASDNKQQVIEVPVTIMNGTDVDFAELYTSGTNVEDWGDNLITGGVTFAPGGGIKATFNVDANNLKWDFKAVDKEGTSLEFNGLDLSNCNANGVTIKLTYDRNTQTGTITAE